MKLILKVDNSPHIKQAIEKLFSDWDFSDPEPKEETLYSDCGARFNTCNEGCDDTYCPYNPDYEDTDNTDDDEEGEWR